MALLRVENVRIAAGGEARPDEGLLVYGDDALVAILVKLDRELALQTRGTWYLQSGFGPIDDFHHPSFKTVEDTLAWIARRLTRNSGKP
jgi:hypothetical protein